VHRSDDVWAGTRSGLSDVCPRGGSGMHGIFSCNTCHLMMACPVCACTDTHTHTHTHSMQILAHPTCTLPRTFTLPHTQKQNDTHTHTLGESITPAGRRMFSARAHQPSICLHNAPPLSIFECNCCRLGRRPRKRLFITLLSAAPPPSLIVKGTRLAMSMLNKSATVRDSTRRPSMQQRLLLMSYDAPAN